MSTYGTGNYGDGTYDGGSSAVTLERSAAIAGSGLVEIGFDIVGGFSQVLLLTPEAGTTETLTAESAGSLVLTAESDDALTLVPEE